MKNTLKIDGLVFGAVEVVWSFLSKFAPYLCLKSRAEILIAFVWLNEYINVLVLCLVVKQGSNNSVKVKLAFLLHSIVYSHWSEVPSNDRNITVIIDKN